MWKLTEEEAKSTYSPAVLANWKVWKEWADKFRAEGFDRFTLVQRENYATVWASSDREMIYAWRGDDEFEWAEPTEEKVTEITELIAEVMNEERMDKEVCKIIAQMTPEWRPKLVNPNQELLDAFRSEHNLPSRFRMWGERYTVIRGGNELEGGNFLVGLTQDGSDFLALWQNAQLWMLFGCKLSLDESDAKGPPQFPTAPTALFHLFTRIIDDNFNLD